MPVLNPVIEGYKPGKLEWRGSGQGYTSCPPSEAPYYETTLTRLTFTSADGTQLEFRDAATGGQPQPNPMGSQCQTGQGFNRGKIFSAWDGSAATFVSDADVKDNLLAGDGPGLPTGQLFFADGTTYRVQDGEIVWLRDRNGNKVTPTTDALGRQVTITLANFQTTLFDQISYKGFGGASRSIKVWYGPLQEILRVSQATDSATIKTYQQLFPGLDLPNLSNYDFNPLLVRRLELPDGRNYQFFYNVYGELARIEVPTGGAIEYDYDGGLAAGTSGLVNLANPGIYRRVIERRVYTDPTNLNSLESKTTFSRPEIRSGTDYDEFVDVTALSASGAVLSKTRHFYHSNAGLSFLVAHFPNDYTDWHEGREYKTEFYNANNVLLKRVENLWEQTPASVAEHNPHISRITTTLTDVTPNLVSKQEFTYDQYNNQTDVYEYDFGSGAPGPLKRRTHTDYVTAAAYTDAVTGAHLRRLPAQVSVVDAGGVERARSTFEYDNYSAAQANHAALTSRTNISGFDAAFSTSYNMRGNVTASTSHLLSNGTVTGSITAHNQYDIAGNVVKSIDPLGFATHFEFLDRFGAPNGEARANSQPAELSSASSYAFVTNVTNALGHSAYTQFDYYLGQPVDSEDVNGTVVSAYFDDLLDRPTQVRRAVGTALANQTTFTYDDVNRTITTTSDFDATNVLVSKSLYDGLGRTVETRTYEGGTNYIAVKEVPFTVQQDPDTGAPLGSMQSSNPYRPHLGEQPAWTTSFMDALGRIVKVRTPDNAIVRTTFSGNTVTVADQTGRKRKSVTDALGRLTEVYEDPAGLNYQTSYSYDALDNLTTVTQGSQTRTFVYDSLKRLTSANNPESGTITYQYDASSNLVVKTDARNVSAHYDYDALSRVVRRWYNGSNSTTATTHNSPALPSAVGASDEVKFYYDSQSLPAGAPSYSRGAATGRLVAQVYGAGSNGDYYGFDVLGRPTLKLQQTGTKNYQMTTAYNLAGAVTAITYPSGHMISNSFDAAGRLSTFNGNLGDGVTRTYANEILYSPFGSLAKEKFGTTTPVYNKLFYNVRGQLAEIRASTSYTGPNDTDANRGAIINSYSDQCAGICSGSTMTDNNGNLKKQEILIPGQATRWQQYDYDSLNRLLWAREVLSTVEQWKQQFTYDRWGNRTIDAAVTHGQINEKSFTVNTSNNRLGVPVGQTGAMTYDAAGNLVNDTYTGAGGRTYDAENKIVSAWGGNNQAQLYSYDGSGQRIKRVIDGVETWQVYGFGGELLAEYAANGGAATPQKEYGYRNGQLLVTAGTAASGRKNFALRSNGGSASASSEIADGCSTWPARGAIDGDRKGSYWGNNGGWADSSSGSFANDWWQVDFDGAKTIDELDIFTLQDNYANPSEPTETMTFSTYGLTAYSVSYWNGSAWINIPEATVVGNNKVWRKFTFAPITTTKIRVFPQAAVDNGYSRLTEVEAWGSVSMPAQTNVALRSNGAVVSASSEFSAACDTWPARGANDGDRKGAYWGSTGGWADASVGNFTDDWLQIEFNGSKTINEIDVFTLQDNYANPVEPTESTTFSTYGLTAYDVSYWNGTSWVQIPETVVTGNNKVWRRFTFSPITTTKIRVFGRAASDNGRSRIVEVEAWSATAASGGNGIQWLVSDHLGTPRMVLDQTGSLAGMKRHDYLPFGEELFAPLHGRTTSQGYASGDGVRQQFTQKERDVETGLDYFLARYYASIQGRFTSPDEFSGGPHELYVLGTGDPVKQALPYADSTNPQTLNKYTYVLNNPLRFIDPDGHQVGSEWVTILLRWFMRQLDPETEAEQPKGGSPLSLDGDKAMYQFTSEIAKNVNTTGEYAEALGLDFGLMDLARNMDRADTVGTMTSGAFVALNVLSMGRGGTASRLEKAAGEQLSKRFIVTKGETIAPYVKMADWIAEKKDGSLGIVMEVFTGTNKSISQVRQQLENGAKYLHSKNITKVSYMVMVNSERAAQRVQKELGKVRGQAVKVIVGP